MSILIALLTFGCLIFIHELGHFLTARVFSVGVLEFSIGMGPKLFSYQSKKSQTVYSIRLLPFGGYVSMYGEDGQGTQEAEQVLQEPRYDFPPEAAFSEKKTWQKMIICAAGAFMNLVFGFLVMMILVLSQPKNANGMTLYGTTTVASFTETAISQNSGLQVGDTILEVNGHNVHVMHDLFYRIILEGSDPMELTVLRGGIEQKITVQFPKNEADPRFSDIDFMVYGEEKSFAVVMKQTYYQSASNVTVVIESLKGLITGKYGMDTMAGPVGVTGEIGQAVSDGARSWASLLVMISINLGICNLLPIPALDGGRLLFLLIELIRRKPIDPKYEGYIHLAGFALLMLLIVFVTFQDIARLISG